MDNPPRDNSQLPPFRLLFTFAETEPPTLEQTCQSQSREPKNIVYGRLVGTNQKGYVVMRGNESFDLVDKSGNSISHPIITGRVIGFEIKDGKAEYRGIGYESDLDKTHLPSSYYILP